MELDRRHFESRSRHFPIADESPEETLTTQELSGWLGVPAATLERLQNNGLGPRSAANTSGVRRYRKADIIAWLNGPAARLQSAVKAAPYQQGELAPGIHKLAKRLGLARFRHVSNSCRGVIVRGSERTRRGRVQALITASRDADITVGCFYLFRPEELSVERPNAILR